MPETKKPPKQRSFRGKVASGVGQGSFFTSLDWVKAQCKSKVGFEPWPGTLNLEVFEEDEPQLKRLLACPGVSMVPPDKNFCEGTCWKVQLSGIPAALVAPEEKARIHGKNIVELLAPVRLKEALKIKDGDVVTVSFEENTAP